MRVVFDIGGTSMRAACATEGGIGEIQKIKTPQEPSEGIGALAKLLRECAGSEPIEATAGGFPGVVADGVVYKAPNLPGWDGAKLAAELSQTLGVSVSVHNDADLAALGEARYGAGRGFRVVAYAGIGTGVGCGRVVDGRIDSGMYDFEAGHQIVDAAAGKELEELVSGRAFEKRFDVHPKEAPRAGYEEMTPVLAAGIYNMIVHWSPDAFLLGGSMMNEENGYRLGDIAAALTRLMNIYPRLPELRIAEFKDTAGLYGARALL
ncbi:ROK family protein [Candidatus Parcubacteria bacterium]|nr:MAG: ROK family protein [Candidatus Parcubacteria bacterium]